MRAIDLDATGWRRVLDFYAALLESLGAPDWHGKNLNALIDSMVWGGINEVEPPYVVRVHNLAPDNSAARAEIVDLLQCIVEARREHILRDGRDVDVAIEIVEETPSPASS